MKHKRLQKELLPILGSKIGMEIIAHSVAAYYKKGYAILKMDATNGFQEVLHAKMHRAVERRCPSQKYYSGESIGLYTVGDLIKVIKICEGCRMGCKLSSFGFDLTLHDAYLAVDEQLQRTATDKQLITHSSKQLLMMWFLPLKRILQTLRHFING